MLVYKLSLLRAVKLLAFFVLVIFSDKVLFASEVVIEVPKPFSIDIREISLCSST